MRLPIPNNRLVALTVVGALLTAAVAGVLAFPFGGFAGLDDTSSGPTTGGVVGDGPTPNEDFTPAVQTTSGHESGEDEHEREDEDEAEDDEHDGGEAAEQEEDEASEEADHVEEDARDAHGDEDDGHREG